MPRNRQRSDRESPVKQRKKEEHVMKERKRKGESEGGQRAVESERGRGVFCCDALIPIAWPIIALGLGPGECIRDRGSRAQVAHP